MFSRIRATIASFTHPDIQFRIFDDADGAAIRNGAFVASRRVGFSRRKIVSKFVFLVGAALIIWGGWVNPGLAVSDQVYIQGLVGMPVNIAMGDLGGAPTKVFDLGNGTKEFIYNKGISSGPMRGVCHVTLVVGRSADEPPGLYILQARGYYRPSWDVDACRIGQDF